MNQDPEGPAVLPDQTSEAPHCVGADISACGAYRYRLDRLGALLGRGAVNFVMLNPSTADAEQDDPTIRRCLGYAFRWGFARLIVTNLYALRSTDPRALWEHPDPIGPGKTTPKLWMMVG